MTADADDFTPEARSDRRELTASGPASRRASDKPLAEPWRDLLLTLSTQLPIDASFEEIGGVFLDHLSALLPHLAVGFCAVAGAGEPPVIDRRFPVGEPLFADSDPTRLFPRLSDEHVIEFDDGATVDSTLHLAAAKGVAIRPLDLQIAERSAIVLGSALKRARAFHRIQRSSRDMERLQAHVIQAEKLASLGQIVAGVVHELNNPLTSIIAYVDYLSKKNKQRPQSPEVEDDAERLRRIAEAAARILKFSRDLVAYSRPSTEVPGPISVSEVIMKAIVFCEHEFATGQVKVDCDVPSDLPPARGVVGQLTQVFVNLFTNAAHAMSEGGGTLRVRAALDSKSNAIIVEVEDEGSGIEQRDLPHIFEPFFTTKSDGRGTGLGLSIVRDIIDQHGGTARVQSSMGQGTVFTVSLPLSPIVSTMPPT